MPLKLPWLPWPPYKYLWFAGSCSPDFLRTPVGSQGATMPSQIPWLPWPPYKYLGLACAYPPKTLRTPVGFYCATMPSNHPWSPWLPSKYLWLACSCPLNLLRTPAATMPPKPLPWLCSFVSIPWSYVCRGWFNPPRPPDLTLSIEHGSTHLRSVLQAAHQAAQQAPSTQAFGPTATNQGLQCTFPAPSSPSWGLNGCPITLWFDAVYCSADNPSNVHLSEL